MNRAMEKAINILVEAKRECEEDYLKADRSFGRRQGWKREYMTMLPAVVPGAFCIVVPK